MTACAAFDIDMDECPDPVAACVAVVPTSRAAAAVAVMMMTVVLLRPRCMEVPFMWVEVGGREFWVKA